NIFREHPGLLFIALQAPPRTGLNSEQAAGCREFARWLREDWLHQFDPTGTDQFEDYPLNNVVPADFHNSIAWTGEDPLLDGAYFWFPVGGFPDDSMDTSVPENIGRQAGSNDHPESWLNERMSVLMCGGADTYTPPHTGNTGRTYECWINAVVNCWEDGYTPQPSVPATGPLGLLGLVVLFGGLLAIRRHERECATAAVEADHPATTSVNAANIV
ncbi:hypothetical protein JW905_18570, partial [bacterium]|nr:hypothetical protein [candidate division CSSED10-310 bacterium]